MTASSPSAYTTLLGRVSSSGSCGSGCTFDLQDHYTHDGEAEDQTGGTALVEGAAAADEETGADGAANGNHVQMAGLHRLMELVGVGSDSTTPEGGRSQTKSGHDALSGSSIDDFGIVVGGNGVVFLGMEAIVAMGQFGVLFFEVGHGDGWVCYRVMAD